MILGKFLKTLSSKDNLSYISVTDIHDNINFKSIEYKNISEIPVEALRKKIKSIHFSYGSTKSINIDIDRNKLSKSDKAHYAREKAISEECEFYSRARKGLNL